MKTRRPKAWQILSAFSIFWIPIFFRLYIASSLIPHENMTENKPNAIFEQENNFL